MLSHGREVIPSEAIEKKGLTINSLSFSFPINSLSTHKLVLSSTHVITLGDRKGREVNTVNTYFDSYIPYAG